MTTSASEQFVVQLSRVAKRGGRHLRGLNSADREDVIAAAVLHCWEHREEFDQHVQPLDQWFADRLKAARRTMQHQTKNHVQLLHDLVSPDTTARTADAQLMAEELVSQLNPEQSYIASLLAEGYSVRAIIAQIPNIDRAAVKTISRKLKMLRSVLPELPIFYSGPKPELEPSESGRIDHSIEALLRGPRPGKECPPCWRCSWYYGYLPNALHWRPAVLADAEVQEAVRNNDNRKIEIANAIRARYNPLFDFPFIERNDE